MIQVRCIGGTRPFFVPKSLILPRSKLFASKYVHCTGDVHADLGNGGIGRYGEGPGEDSFGRYLELLDTGDIVSWGESEFDRCISILQLYHVAEMLEDSKSANMILDKIAEALHQGSLRPGLIGAINFCVYETCFDLVLPQQLMIDFITACMTSQELESLFEEQPYCAGGMCKEVALALARQREKEGRTPHKKLEQLDKYYLKD